MDQSSVTRFRPVRGALWAVFLTVLVLGLTSACGGGSGGDESGQSAGAAHSSKVEKVAIKNFLFAPAELTASVGDKLAVTNDDSAPHSLTADDGTFDTGTLAKGADKTVTLEKAGTFAFHCTIHPYMKGTVTVSQ